jgi:hypothetical protein
VARITFQKRQKEMKRLEKARMKAERRVQRKLEKGTGTDSSFDVENMEVLNGPPEIEPYDDETAAAATTAK